MEDAEPEIDANQDPGDLAAEEELDSGPTEPAIGRTDSPVSAVQDRIRHYLHSLRSHHSVAVETGAVEAIHKMRVSTRRLQAAIDLLQSGQNESRAVSVKKRLRKLRHSLAAVRNYDVFISMVEQEAAGRRPSIQRYQNELVTAELQNRRARALLKVKQTLGSAHLGELSDRVREVCGIHKHPHHGGTEGAGLPSSDHHHNEMLKRRAVDRLEQRLAELQHLAARIDIASSAESIHRLRIAAKRLRYLLELVSEMGYGDARRTVEWLKLLQDRLGDLHDIDAFQQEVIDIVSRPKFLKNHMLESGGMLYAAARVVGGRDALCAKTFPVRIPLSVGATTRRLARSLAKSGPAQSQAVVSHPEAVDSNSPTPPTEALTPQTHKVTTSGEQFESEATTEDTNPTVVEEPEHRVAATESGESAQQAAGAVE